MYTNKPIRILSKCICILEMIQKVNNRIQQVKADIAIYDKSSWDTPIRIMNTKESYTETLTKLFKVAARLESYYHNTLDKIMVHA